MTTTTAVPPAPAGPAASVPARPQVPRDGQLIWDMDKELMAAERHFNSMQNVCRTMASSWLLAAFGGIGFVLAQSTWGDRHLAGGCIAIAAAVGLVLLWILDVRVWHRLLLRNYYEGRVFEKEYPWLPQVRAATDPRRPVRRYISIFYAAGVTLLLVIAFLGIGRHLRGSDFRSLWYLASGLATLAIAFYMAHLARPED